MHASIKNSLSIVYNNFYYFVIQFSEANMRIKTEE